MKRNIDIITQYNCSYEDVSFVYLYTYEMRAYRQKFLWNVGLYIKTSWLKKKNTDCCVLHDKLNMTYSRTSTNDQLSTSPLVKEKVQHFSSKKTFV